MRQSLKSKSALLKTAALLASLLMFSPACQSAPLRLGPEFGPQEQSAAQILGNGYEAARYLSASDFLTANEMQSPLHKVSPQTYNDGYANTYEITTPQHVFVVQGTEQARERIYEIKATEILRSTPTIAAAAKSITDRTKNLVQTPIRAVKGGAARYSNVKTSKYGLPEDSIGVVKSGLGSVMGKLGHGMKELGKTGVRITTGAAGTKCSGLECAQKAGEDVWSGFNSLVGKHAAARRIHQRLGTDPYSDNEVLQKHASRLAYAESYTGTTYKFGVAGAGIAFVSPLAKGVGYYNNAEFAAQYEDAHKRRNIEKELYTHWGADKNAINTLYKNEVFTHTTRTRLAAALGHIHSPSFRVRAIKDASGANTHYIANSQLAIYQYLAKQDQDSNIGGYIDNAPMAMAIDRSNTLILPLFADYLQWTPEIAPLVKNFAALAGMGTAYPYAEIHILGKTSPMFTRKAKQLGVNIRQVSP